MDNKILIGKLYKNTINGELRKVLSISKDNFVVLSGNYMCPIDCFDKDWELSKGLQYEDSNRVNHPSYYKDPSGVECITVARYRDFNIGNALKYLWRAGLKKEDGLSDKDKTIEDLKKAIWYIEDEIKLLENKE